MKRIIWVNLTMLLLVSCGKSFTPTAPSPTATPAPPRENTVIEYQASAVDFVYKIYVSLPIGYDPAASVGYQVIYLLDGDWFFDGADLWTPKGGIIKLVKDLTRQGTLPPTIVVGIGNEEKRERDFYIEPENFYSFIKNELIPMIEDEYNTISSRDGRTLIGHSSAGYFVMYSLLTHESQDNLFHNMIALSGDYTINDNAMLIAERELAGHGGVLDVNLYMGLAASEYVHTIQSNRDMKDQLRSRGYQGLRLKYDEYSSGDHYGLIVPASRIGLTWMFEK